MNLIATTTSFPLRRMRVKENRQENFKIDFLIKIIAFAIVVFGVIYIMQTNSVIEAGYKIETYENNIDDLRETNRNMELSLSAKHSYAYLKNAGEMLKMEKVSEMKYLKLENESLAAITNP